MPIVEELNMLPDKVAPLKLNSVGRNPDGKPLPLTILSGVIPDSDEFSPCSKENPGKMCTI